MGACAADRDYRRLEDSPITRHKPSGRDLTLPRTDRMRENRHTKGAPPTGCPFGAGGSDRDDVVIVRRHRGLATFHSRSQTDTELGSTAALTVARISNRSAS